LPLALHVGLRIQLLTELIVKKIKVVISKYKFYDIKI